MKYRDHYPANDQTRSHMRDAYVETRALYVQLYGEPDQMLWPEQGNRTCGDSYSGFISSSDEVD